MYKNNLFRNKSNTSSCKNLSCIASGFKLREKLGKKHVSCAVLSFRIKTNEVSVFILGKVASNNKKCLLLTNVVFN